MGYNGNENMIVCPYDPVHVIRASRFVRHLMKCRKNHALSDKVSCPYNATHIMAKPELEYHLSLCPNRKIEEQMAKGALDTCDQEERKGDITVPPYHYEEKITFGPVQESWDKEYKTVVPVLDQEGKLRNKVLKNRKQLMKQYSECHGLRRPISSSKSYTKSISSFKM